MIQKSVKNFCIDNAKCLSVLMENFYILDFILWQFLLSLLVPFFFLNAINGLTRHLEDVIIDCIALGWGNTLAYKVKPIRRQSLAVGA